jgi:histidinol phosphatase-like PHP family hydrolase
MKIPAIFAIVFLCLGISVTAQQKDPFQLIDLHIHLKGGFTIDNAIEKSENENVKYGIAVNCGIGFPVQNDSQLDSCISEMKKYPQFYNGMQAEGREWVNLFTKESINKFDYVFTDAMTFVDKKGRRNRIWLENETWIDDEQQFMDDLVALIIKIINTEPIDIYVNPTYLPGKIAGKYKELWTESRMEKVIQSAKKNNVAIEINNRFRIPSYELILKAKKEGVKFSIGTNNVDGDFSGPDYAREMITKCDLQESDFFIPERKLKIENRK